MRPILRSGYDSCEPVPKYTRSLKEPSSSNNVPTRARSSNAFGTVTDSLTLNPPTTGVTNWVCLKETPVLVCQVLVILIDVVVCLTTQSVREISRIPYRSHLVAICPMRSLSVGALHSETDGATIPYGKII